MNNEIDWDLAMNDPVIRVLAWKRQKEKVFLKEYTDYATKKPDAWKPHPVKIPYNREFLLMSIKDLARGIIEIQDKINEEKRNEDDRLFKLFSEILEVDDSDHNFVKAKEIDKQRTDLYKNYNLSGSQFIEIYGNANEILNAFNMFELDENPNVQDLSIPVEKRIKSFIENNTEKSADV